MHIDIHYKEYQYLNGENAPQADNHDVTLLACKAEGFRQLIEAESYAQWLLTNLCMFVHVICALSLHSTEGLYVHDGMV